MPSTVRFILSDHCASLYYDLTSWRVYLLLIVGVEWLRRRGLRRGFEGAVPPKIDVRAGALVPRKFCMDIERYVPKKEVHLGAGGRWRGGQWQAILGLDFAFGPAAAKEELI